MKSLPTVIDPSNYYQQLDNNNAQASQLLAVIFPQISVPYHHLYNIIYYLQETSVNPELVPQVVRGIHNLVIGSGKGQVIIHVSRDKSNVEVRETSRQIKTKK